MREEYDFSNAVKNPYVGKLKQQITIRLDEQVIDYFKKMSEETGMPYQNIINYYLLDCVKEKKHMEVAFVKQKHITQFSKPQAVKLPAVQPIVRLMAHCATCCQ